MGGGGFAQLWVGRRHQPSLLGRAREKKLPRGAERRESIQPEKGSARAHCVPSEWKSKCKGPGVREREHVLSKIKLRFVRVGVQSWGWGCWREAEWQETYGQMTDDLVNHVKEFNFIPRAKGSHEGF